MKRLVLFDIDETIVHSNGVGRRAIETALQQVFDGSIDASKHSMSGKTDPQICHEILSLAGYKSDEINSKLPKLFEIYISLLEEEIHKIGAFSLHVGVVEILRELEQAPWCYLGLLTGNIEPGARLKLTPFDLNSFFAFGAFGCDSANRMDLPAVANRRANDIFAQTFTPDEIVIIGDAINDILCAQGYGARTVITCTGRTSKTSLQELNPDHIFDSLADTGKVLQAIMA